MIWVGMESKSSQAVCLTENCILKVTVAPVKPYQENGSTSGSPGHQRPCHEFSKVREAGKKRFSLTHEEQFVQKKIQISRVYVLFDTHCGGFLHGSSCPVSCNLHLFSGGLEALGEGAAFLCHPVSGEKKNLTIHCALQGPSAAALLSGHVRQMGKVLFVIEFKPSYPKILPFGWIFR